MKILFSSLGKSFIKIRKQVTEQEKQQSAKSRRQIHQAGCKMNCCKPYNPDVLDDGVQSGKSEMAGESPMAKEEAFNKLHDELKEKAAEVFHSSDLRDT